MTVWRMVWKSVGINLVSSKVYMKAQNGLETLNKTIKKKWSKNVNKVKKKWRNSLEIFSFHGKRFCLSGKLSDVYLSVSFFYSPIGPSFCMKAWMVSEWCHERQPFSIIPHSVRAFFYFLVQKDWKKSWVIFWCKKIEKKVGSLFSAKRLKKKLGHFLVQKDWKKSWVTF